MFFLFFYQRKKKQKIANFVIKYYTVINPFQLFSYCIYISKSVLLNRNSESEQWERCARLKNLKAGIYSFSKLCDKSFEYCAPITEHEVLGENVSLSEEKYKTR